MTPAGGELRILDSGFYGNNAIVNKALTVTGNGNTVYLGTSITIDDADAVVALRGLRLDGQGTIADGVRIEAAAVVHIERCLVQGFDDQGIDVDGATEVQVFVHDSIARENSDSTFTENVTGIANSDLVQTLKNNIIRGNTNDLTGTAPIAIGGL